MSQNLNQDVLAPRNVPVSRSLGHPAGTWTEREADGGISLVLPTTAPRPPPSPSLHPPFSFHSAPSNSLCVSQHFWSSFSLLSSVGYWLAYSFCTLCAAFLCPTALLTRSFCSLTPAAWAGPVTAPPIPTALCLTRISELSIQMDKIQLDQYIRHPPIQSAVLQVES